MDAGKIIPAVILYAVASLSDIATTLIGLQYGFVESNEIAWTVISRYGWHVYFICDMLYFLMASALIILFSKLLKGIAGGNKTVVKIADNLYIVLYVLAGIRFIPAIHNFILVSKVVGA